VLDRFDLAVASIHGRFELDRKAQTDRLLRAISNPHTTILGHMTGRQLQRRPGYDIDVEKVLAPAPDMGSPWRSTPTRGAWTSTGAGTRPRSHSIRELDHMHWGVEMARQGGVPSNPVLNAMSLPWEWGHDRRRP
jgi:DNA polymerase (family 10)